MKVQYPPARPGTPERVTVQARTGQKPTWIEQLPEAMRADTSLHGFKTIGDLVTGYKASVTAREGLIKVPGEGASAEDVAAYRKALGVPDAADKYTIAKPADLPESVPYDPAFEGVYKQVALESGLTDAQASTLWNWYYGLAKQGAEQEAKAEAQARERSVNALKDEWKGDTFKANMESATRAFKKFGGKESARMLEEGTLDGMNLGDHPAFVKLFYSISKSISEDSAVVTGGQGEGNKVENPLMDERFLKETMFPSMK